jgi:hypothetical protein
LSPPPEVVGAYDQPDSEWGAGHRGADLLGAEDQQVRAAGAGVVTYAGLLAGRGVVAVSHGGLRTTYEPVTPTVDVGARVSAGTVIGTLARTQSHCAPRVCLHWGAIRGGHYLNPVGLLLPSRPRLLPLDGAESQPDVRRYGAAADAWAQNRTADEQSSRVMASDAASTSGESDAVTTAAGTDDAKPAGKTVDPPERTLSTAVTTFVPPAAGALAGAIAAGLVVRLSRRSRGGGPSPPVPPLNWPPASVARGDPGGVIELDTIRHRLRDAA